LLAAAAVKSEEQVIKMLLIVNMSKDHKFREAGKKLQGFRLSFRNRMS